MRDSDGRNRWDALSLEEGGAKGRGGGDGGRGAAGGSGKERERAGRARERECVSELGGQLGGRGGWWWWGIAGYHASERHNPSLSWESEGPANVSKRGVAGLRQCELWQRGRSCLRGFSTR
jgi:hypothetical protein